MNTQLVIWLFIAAFAMLVILVRGLEVLRHHSHHTKQRIIELATESEELFIPGDQSENDNTYNDID